MSFRSSDEHVCCKGYQRAVLRDAGGRELLLINTHLDATGDAKRHQFAQLARAVAAAPPHQRVIVCGDFNICQQHRWDAGELYAALSAAMEPLRDLCSDAALVTFDADGACYDHVFTNAPALVPIRLAPGKGISDHNGVVGEVRSDVHLRRYRPEDEAAVKALFSANLTEEWSAYPAHLAKVRLCFGESPAASDGDRHRTHRPARTLASP